MENRIVRILVVCVSILIIAASTIYLSYAVDLLTNGGVETQMINIIVSNSFHSVGPLELVKIVQCIHQISPAYELLPKCYPYDKYLRYLSPKEAAELVDRINKTPQEKFRFSVIRKRIAYLYIKTITDDTAEKIDASLQYSAGQGVNKVLIDLQENYGGSFNGLLDILNLFSPAKRLLIGTVETLNSKRKIFTKVKGKYAQGWKIAVLVDKYTASAAEMLAGVLQVWGQAKVFGTLTFGKGAMQDLFLLNNEGVLVLTVAHFRLPNEVGIEGEGILPNVLVDNSDKKIKKALAYLINPKAVRILKHNNLQ